MPRTMITDEQITEGLLKFRRHLDKVLARKGKGTFSSMHEILGMLTEEIAEALVEARCNNARSFSLELLDIAVAAIFGATCLDNYVTDDTVNLARPTSGIEYEEGPTIPPGYISPGVNIPHGYISPGVNIPTESFSPLYQESNLISPRSRPASGETTR